jgi:hypothetical protein
VTYIKNQAAKVRMYNGVTATGILKRRNASELVGKKGVKSTTTTS